METQHKTTIWKTSPKPRAQQNDPRLLLMLLIQPHQSMRFPVVRLYYQDMLELKTFGTFVLNKSFLTKVPLVHGNPLVNFVKKRQLQRGWADGAHGHASGYSRLWQHPVQESTGKRTHRESPGRLKHQSHSCIFCRSSRVSCHSTSEAWIINTIESTKSPTSIPEASGACPAAPSLSGSDLGQPYVEKKMTEKVVENIIWKHIKSLENSERNAPAEFAHNLPNRWCQATHLVELLLLLLFLPSSLELLLLNHLREIIGKTKTSMVDKPSMVCSLK